MYIYIYIYAVANFAYLLATYTFKLKKKYSINSNFISDYVKSYIELVFSQT